MTFKVTKVSYTLKNELDWHNNTETITLTAEIDGDWVEAFKALKEQAINEVASKHLGDVCEEVRDQERKLKKLNEEIAKSTQRWNQLRTFYSAQGIKELADIPQFNNLLPPVIQGEIVDEKKSMTSPSNDEF